MAFPQTPLDLRVDLQLNGTWTDITEDVRADAGVTITRGRADEANRPDPQTCQLTLDNRDGRYSPRNPMSPYYGVLGRNAPLRVGVGRPPLGAGQSTTVDSTSLVAPSVTAEVSSRQFTVWGAMSAGTITLPAGFTAATQRDGALGSGWHRGTRNVAAGATGTATATYSTTATSQVGVNVVVPGGATTFTGYSGIETGANMTLTGLPVSAGDWLIVFHGWSSDPRGEMVRPPFLLDARPPAWILLADTGPGDAPRLQAWALRVHTAGAIDVTMDAIYDADNFGRVEVVTGVTDYLVRFTGEVSDWPVTWDLAGADIATSITASGMRRRLGSGVSPLESALRSELGQRNLVAYWPLEDGASASRFGSATGGPSMSFIGSPVLAADSGFPASLDLPTFNAAGARGVVPSHTTTNQFVVGSLVHMPAGLADEAVLLTITATGTARTWTVKYEAGAVGFRVEAWDDDGASLANVPIGPWTVPVIGARMYLMLSVEASGADISWTLRGVQVQADGTELPLQLTSTITGRTVGRVTAVQLGNGDVPLNSDVTFGHVAVAAATNVLNSTDVFHAVAAWTADAAVTRIRNIARIIDAYVGNQASYVLSDKMGPRLVETALDAIDEAADADGGVLIEPKGYLGFHMRSKASKLSQASSLTLDYRTPGHVGHPLQPVDDDQATVNDVTVTRRGGASARHEVTSGRLSVLPPPAGVGRYDVAHELSLFTDDQAAERAAWLAHLGTWDEARWPTVMTRLDVATALISPVCLLDVGDVITLDGLPAWVPPGPTRLMLEGYTETLGPFEWTFTGNYSPAGPWSVMVPDSSGFSRLDAEGSTVNSSLTSTATSMSVATAAGHPLWVTTATVPSAFPFPVLVGGERMTVTAITGAASPQTFTVTRSVNGVVKSHTVGTEVRLAEPVVLA